MNQLLGDLNLTPSLLGLSDIEIISVKEAASGDIHVAVKSTDSKTFCRKCHGSTEPYGSGRQLLLRHLPMFGRKVVIEIKPPRGICKRCDDHLTTTQTLDWFQRNGHYTKPYEDYLMLQLIGSTITDVAKKEGLTAARLQRVLDRYKIDEVDWKTIKRIGLLGIDEIVKLKGHNDYVTLVTSFYHGENKILTVLEGKKEATIKAFLASIPLKKRKSITAVCVDMCDNYINAVEQALDQEIPVIVDRFQVAKLYRRVIQKLRSKERKRLKKTLSEEADKALRPAINILISKHECYSAADRKILASLFKYSPG